MTMIRQDKLENDKYYHIYSRSIAKYLIFNNDKEYAHMIMLFNLLRYIDFPCKMSRYLEYTIEKQNQIFNVVQLTSKSYVDIVAYCLMPTHFHLILKQNANDGISKYMSKILNSYSKYFNTKHNRKGPLWTGRFKNVLVEDDEQMLHLTRYIHLNPTSANLVKKPDDWIFSSYNEYLNNPRSDYFCSYKNILNIKPKEYEKFVLDHKNYQQSLSVIKNMIIEKYSG